MKNTGYYVIGAICLLLGFFLTKAFSPTCPDIRSDTVEIHHLDTVRFTVKITKDTGSIRITNKFVHDTIRDTVKVFNNYFTKYGYKRIILDNDTLFLQLQDSITENKIYSSSGKYVWKLPAQTITNKPLPALKNELYVGGSIGGNTDLFSISGMVTFKTKRGVLYTPGVALMPKVSKHPVFMFGVQFKL